MMSPSPAWRREGNEGVRPGAHIEIVIDLQLHCLEGGRLFMTQSGALQTPDWISNRHFIYAFDRQSGHPIWANRPYPEVRLPLEKALNAYRDDLNSRLPIFPEEPHTLLADGSAGSFATCLMNFGIDTFPEWLDTVQRSETPVVLDEQAWRDIHIPDDHAGKTPETVCYGRSVSVWPSAAPQLSCEWRSVSGTSVRTTTRRSTSSTLPAFVLPVPLAILTEWSTASSVRHDLNLTQISR